MTNCASDLVGYLIFSVRLLYGRNLLSVKKACISVNVHGALQLHPNLMSDIKCGDRFRNSIPAFTFKEWDHRHRHDWRDNHNMSMKLRLNLVYYYNKYITLISHSDFLRLSLGETNYSLKEHIKEYFNTFWLAKYSDTIFTLFKYLVFNLKLVLCTYT